MDPDEDMATRDKAPSNADQWRWIWQGSDKAHKSWVVVAPLYAAFRYWRWVVGATVLAVWFNADGLVALIKAVAEAWK